MKYIDDDITLNELLAELCGRMGHMDLAAKANPKELVNPDIVFLMKMIRKLIVILNKNGIK